MANVDLFFGVAVEDREVDSRKIRIHLRELLPFHSGEIGDKTKEESYNLKNEKDEEIAGDVKTSNHVVADYFGLATNNKHPPCIVKGEQVVVFKYTGEDKYYWISFGRDDNLRRGDIYKLCASNDMSNNKELTDDNTYFMEINTKTDKLVRIHTSTSDGEKYSYDISIKPKENKLAINDSNGNVFLIKSDEKRVTLNTGGNSIINMINDSIEIFAPRNIFIRAGNILGLFDPVNIGKCNSICKGGTSDDVSGNIEW